MFLEHVNMSVLDLERTIDFYYRILDLGVRWRGTTTDGTPAAHVGDDRCYLAFFEVGAGAEASGRYDQAGLNHFGWVVDDLEAVRGRLAELDVRPHMEADYEPGRRLYFLDPNGVEVELVEYDQPSAS